MHDHHDALLARCTACTMHCLMARTHEPDAKQEVACGSSSTCKAHAALMGRKCISKSSGYRATSCATGHHDRCPSHRCSAPTLDLQDGAGLASRWSAASFTSLTSSTTRLAAFSAAHPSWRGHCSRCLSGIRRRLTLTCQSTAVTSLGHSCENRGRGRSWPSLTLRAVHSATCPSLTTRTGCGVSPRTNKARRRALMH